MPKGLSEAITFHIILPFVVLHQPQTSHALIHLTPCEFVYAAKLQQFFSQYSLQVNSHLTLIWLKKKHIMSGQVGIQYHDATGVRFTTMSQWQMGEHHTGWVLAIIQRLGRYNFWFAFYMYFPFMLCLWSLVFHVLLLSFSFFCFNLLSSAQSLVSNQSAFNS